MRGVLASLVLLVAVDVVAAQYCAAPTKVTHAAPVVHAQPVAAYVAPTYLYYPVYPSYYYANYPQQQQPSASDTLLRELVKSLVTKSPQAQLKKEQDTDVSFSAEEVQQLRVLLQRLAVTEKKE